MRKGESAHVKTRREQLSRVEIGKLCLSKMCISSDNFKLSEIAYIGACSVNRKHIVVARFGLKWQVMDATERNIALARSHGYVIKGKKCIPLYHTHGKNMEECIKWYNRESVGKPLSKSRTQDIFMECLGHSSRKHGKRGGVTFDILSGIYSTPDHAEHREWKRGEKNHYRAFNRKNMTQTLKDENFTNTIKAGMYGVIYKSNPCATKSNTKRYE